MWAKVYFNRKHCAKEWERDQEEIILVYPGLILHLPPGQIIIHFFLHYYCDILKYCSYATPGKHTANPSRREAYCLGTVVSVSVLGPDDCWFTTKRELPSPEWRPLCLCTSSSISTCLLTKDCTTPTDPRAYVPALFQWGDWDSLFTSGHWWQ